MAGETSQPEAQRVERQGVVTDSIVAFSEGLGIGAGGVGAAKFIDALTGAKPPEPEPKQEVVLPPGVERPARD